jgi:hypothetical protein
MTGEIVTIRMDQLSAKLAYPSMYPFLAGIDDLGVLLSF